METQTFQRNPKRSTIAVVSALSLIAGMGITSVVERHYSGVAPVNAASYAAPSAMPQSLPDFASLAKRLGPSVVNVATTQVRQAARSGLRSGDDQMGEFFSAFSASRRRADRNAKAARAPVLSSITTARS